MYTREKAKNLINENWSLVVFKNNEFIKLKGMGIKPVIDCLDKDTGYFKECIVADKIVGKAAAMLMIYSKASYVYGEIMSQKAVEMFEKYKVDYEYKKLVPYIKNRTEDGMCPMENAVWNLENINETYSVIKNTLQSLSKAKI